MARALLGFLLAITTLLIPTTSIAMNVSPMIVELASTGTSATGRIQVINVNKDDLPYEVRVYQIAIDDKGTLTETPADGDFIVFPPQGVLKQDQRQMVRVQWVGGALDASRAYYVSINQLPVTLDPAKVDKDKASVDVQMVYHMKVLVTVAPPGSAPDVSVVSAQPTLVAAAAASPTATADSPPVPGVKVTIRNAGRRYAMLAAVSWTIEGKGLDGKPLKVVKTAEQMGQILGAGYVPALNGVRTFDVPTGTAFAAAPISVKFAD